MSFVKSPTLTAAKLAANRLNARKSTGPRTYRGKGYVTLNALKHGRYASRLFRTNLVRNRQDVGLYDWFYQQVCRNLPPGNKRQWQDAEQVACEVWCFFRAVGREGVRRGLQPPKRGSVWCLLRIPTRFTKGMGTNPPCAVKSTDAFATFPSRMDIPLGRTRGAAAVLDATEAETALPAGRDPGPSPESGTRTPILPWPDILAVKVMGRDQAAVETGSGILRLQRVKVVATVSAFLTVGFLIPRRTHFTAGWFDVTSRKLPGSPLTKGAGLRNIR